MASIELFSYKQGNSLLHKMPPLPKLLLLFAGPALLFSMPETAALPAAVTLCIISFLCGFGPAEKLGNLKPVLAYALLLYTSDILAAAFSLMAVEPTAAAGPAATAIQTATANSPLRVFIPSANTRSLLVRLLPALQLTALFFRTTSPLQLRSGLESAEFLVTRKIRLAPVFSLFLGFIPLVSRTWLRLDRAWRARGGKNSPGRILTLIPVLISVCMHRAAQTSLAMANRMWPDHQ